ncbi:MAG: sugar transferase [Acidobacteriia bacterium]|nr:sugar transferase [Terriglobia bacterium]
MKRMFDIILSTLGLIVVLPLFPVIAVWIKFDSPGPVFYRGVRAGRFGRPFRIFKFRTMVADAEARGGAETPADDPRITHAGSILRRYKIDELPQLINVLCGDMSLVGPRPEVMDEVVLYDHDERELLRVRPGITDWASIKLRHEGEILRGSTDPHRMYHEKIRPEKVRLGLEYVRNGNSLRADIKIILTTLWELYLD